ncbi:MAG: hypothetical protein QOG72_2155 [Sphingomonadales bacterium]|jgi:hypothetical protein|nr:hypothetical protein [Sphingomonadales bacterium]
MDEPRRPKVGDLLPERFDGLEERVKSQLSEDPGTGGNKLAWDLIGSEVEGALRSVLDCDLIETLARAWTTARALQDYADPAKHPAGEAAVVHLGEREVERELHPVVAVSIGGCPPMELRFTLTLAAHFSGLAVTIRAPRVTGGSAGDVKVSAQLSYGEVKLHKAAESRKIALPGHFRFDPPLEIPRRA